MKKAKQQDRRAFRKEERQEQIEREIAVAMVMSRQGLSMRQVAARLGMKPSGHVMNLLFEMCEAGRLDYKVQQYRSGGFGANRFEFYIPANRFAEAIRAVYEVA